MMDVTALVLILAAVGIGVFAFLLWVAYRLASWRDR